MSIRFAAPYTPGQSSANLYVSKSLFQPVPRHAVNDNGADHGTDSDHRLQAALRHFAEHGLGAARSAREQAQKAFFANDHQAYDWWIGITRALDRRLAAEAEREFTLKVLDSPML
ncbi:hypothetical protein FGU71_11075 [Erythrobacter insulae]|uniref:Uncharacterized protein n=1 Tax=Erythrobacter insulae TaxID=2584124 RepID=A0A547PDY3_9SPHN|nr:hypothetical protein [Erythrobacter insulae]TRD12353.1 hypothetical protein FGU71_11075 [Erythrobacter insulae]